MDYEKSLQDVEKTLTDLIEENQNVPIIVEGDKDIEALRKLGITGTIIRVHIGMSIADFCDMIAKKYRKIILLTDWDHKGGHLCYALKKNLESRVKCNTRYRKIFAQITSIRTLESLPSWITTVQNKIYLNRNHTFTSP